MALDDDVRILSAVSLFEGFTVEQLRLLAFGADRILLPARRRLFREEDEADTAYVVVNGEIMLTDGLRASVDVAYLPAVKFDGTDDHVLRSLISPEWGWGRGVQLEAILSYAVTPAFSVGAGGRYWAMWTREAYTAFGGGPCPCQTLPSRTERYGMFLQAAYRFDAPAAVVARY